MTNKEFREKLIKRTYFYALKAMELSDKLPNKKSC